MGETGRDWSKSSNSLWRAWSLSCEIQGSGTVQPGGQMAQGKHECLQNLFGLGPDQPVVASPALSREVRVYDLQRFFPNSTVPWFCDSVKHIVVFYCSWSMQQSHPFTSYVDHASIKENGQIIDSVLCKRANLSSEQISIFDTVLLVLNQRRYHRG